VIDIHCHILPGIDDGPDDIEESLEMARIASHDGITKIVATPHIKESLHPAEFIREKVADLNDRLAELEIPVTIFQGADVSSQVDISFFRNYTINGTRYILIEFPHIYLPRNSKEILFSLITRGFQPIITHPERNLSVLNNPKALLEILDEGILIQVTADSITGRFGIDIQECAFYLLKKGTVDLIATDAHSSQRRRPILSAGVKKAAGLIGAKKAARLVEENPERILQDEPIHD
jgi:protein-tyrosine phosphatase